MFGKVIQHHIQRKSTAQCIEHLIHFQR